MKAKAAIPFSSRISALIVILFGDPQTIILETRAFNATLFLVFCAGVVSTIENIFAGISLIMIALTISAAMVSAGAYYASRKMGIWKPLVLPVYLIFLCILSYGWIMQGGLSGSIVFYFFLLTCAAIIVFQGFYKMLALLLVCSFVLALILIEISHPGAIVPYASTGQRYFDVSTSLIICLLTNGIMTYIVFREYVRERTAKNLLLESVVKEKERAEQAVIAKQRLLSMISHDIANAVFIIQVNSQMLLSAGEPGREELKHRMAGIITGAKNIREIIESVRMLRAIEEGRAALKLEKVRLEQMLDDVRPLVADRLKHKDISLFVQQPGAEPCTLLVEPRMFCNHVISNLLTNAIKFSRPGSSIVISAETKDGHSMVSVVDKGIGIPRSLVEQLFQPGEKTSRKGTINEPGTGLGLLVVKSFVELFGGTIELSSRCEDEFPDDHGTTVSLHVKSA
jgi:Signal transduction histidine kinase